jgi:hypothetical protein
LKYPAVVSKGSKCKLHSQLVALSIATNRQHFGPHPFDRFHGIVSFWNEQYTGNSLFFQKKPLEKQVRQSAKDSAPCCVMM